jgi:hypothetical protein
MSTMERVLVLFDIKRAGTFGEGKSGRKAGPRKGGIPSQGLFRFVEE